jgi:DNA-binding beta-propeller fold protein YncE
MRLVRHALIGILAACICAGCGGKYDKPLEVDREPASGAYNYAGSYQDGFNLSTHMAMTQGSLFISYRVEGDVRRFFGSGRRVGDVVFSDLTAPGVVGVGGKLIAIADSTESLMVRVYSISGGAPLVSFTDPEWKEIGGLALDDTGNVYVSDVVRNFVRAYDPEGQPLFQVDLADSGSGIGHVLSPRGIYVDGDVLFIAEADAEKSQVQKISITDPQQGIWFSETIPLLNAYTDTAGNEISLMKPISVATDSEGNVLVLDETLSKIIRYTPEGVSDAIVNTLQAKGPDSFEQPTGIGTFGSRVYCLDVGTGIVHRWDAQ